MSAALHSATQDDCVAWVQSTERTTDIAFRGVSGLAVICDPSLDIVAVMPKPSPGFCPDFARLVLANVGQLHRGTRSGNAATRRWNWIATRTASRVFVYLRSELASIVPSGSTNDCLVCADAGLVYLQDIRDVSVLKTGSTVRVIGREFVREAVDAIYSVVGDCPVAHEKPEHVLRRLQIPMYPAEEIAEIVAGSYSLPVRRIEAPPGARASGSGYEVHLSDGRRYILKYLGDGLTEASVLSQIADWCPDIFPRPVPVVCRECSAGSPFLLRVGDGYYVLEEYIASCADTRFRDCCSSLGRCVGLFHRRMESMRHDHGAVVELLPKYQHCWLSPHLMRLDFRMSLHDDTLPAGATEFLRENYDMIDSELDALSRQEYVRTLAELPDHIIHRDLNRANVFLQGGERMRVVDMESMCVAPRVNEFPHVLIGQGGGRELRYRRGDLPALIEGYDSVVEVRLTQAELAVIPPLVKHRFLLQFLILVVKNQTDNVASLVRMVESFRTFCKETG